MTMCRCGTSRYRPLAPRTVEPAIVTERVYRPPSCTDAGVGCVDRSKTRGVSTGVVVASDPKNAHVGLPVGPAPGGYPSGAPPRERSTVIRDPAVAGARRRGGEEGMHIGRDGKCAPELTSFRSSAGGCSVCVRGTDSEPCGYIYRERRVYAPYIKGMVGGDGRVSTVPHHRPLPTPHPVRTISRGQGTQLPP